MMLVDLDPGTVYQVRVIAKNGHGYEAAAAWLAFHTPGTGQSHARCLLSTSQLIIS